jgi:hypothetical protein
MSDRNAELRESLPTVAAVVDRFAAAFGRSNFSVSYASEAGHVLGKKSEGNHPCHDCRHFFLKMVSLDGKRVQHSCERYRGTVAARCADFAGRV